MFHKEYSSLAFYYQKENMVNVPNDGMLTLTPEFHTAFHEKPSLRMSGTSLSMIDFLKIHTGEIKVSAPLPPWL